MRNNKKKSVNEKFDYLQVFGYMAIVVILLSMLNFGMKLTGYATDTSTINVTVESSATINFTTDAVVFGSGQVLSGANVTLISNASGTATGGNWTQPATNLMLENLGNVNVSLNIKTGKNSTTLIGGTNPAYQFVVNNNEQGSCGIPSVTFGTYYDVNMTDPGTLVCDSFLRQNTNDTLNITIKLVIPSDSKTGILEDTMTATATTVSP